MSTNTDKIIKLGTKLGAIEEKIANLQQERDTVAAEIGGLLGISSYTNGNVTAPVGKKTAKVGDLSTKIANYLQTTAGATITSIAKALKVAPNQVGLALYHMSKKGKAFENPETEMWYTSGNFGAVTAGSKTAPASDDEMEEPF